MQLSRERITGAALGILREYGLADVSMRRVATTLGVAPGALYWHVANKQELIATVAEAIVQPLLDGPVPDPAALSRQLRELILGVRDGAEVVVAAVGQPDSQVRDDLERRFDEAVRLAAEGASTRVTVFVCSCSIHTKRSAGNPRMPARRERFALTSSGLSPTCVPRLKES